MNQQKKVIAGGLAVCIGAAAVPQLSGQAAAVYLPLNRNRTDTVYSDLQSTAYASCNDVYYDAWNGSVGSYLAYDLSDIPQEQRAVINVAWYSGAWNNYDYTVLKESPGASLSSYRISVNAAAGGSYPETGWEEIVTVEDYTAHSGENSFPFAGYNWVRIEVLGVQNGGKNVSLNVDIHSVMNGLVDSWMFYGDSITACGMVTFSAGDGNFADFLHELDPRFYPAQENGGIGGVLSTHGKANIDRWLKQFPGQYVSIAYGTNDCWGDQTGTEQYYENLVYMIRAIQAAGKTAVLPKIPFSLEKGISEHVERYNAKVDQIYAEFPDVIPGPDFYTWFKENPDMLSGDGVHPSDAGYNAMRRIWAETVLEAVYQKRGTEQPSGAQRGDVNADGDISIADAVLLTKYLARTETKLPDWRAADLNEDSTLDASDLSLLKQRLMTGSINPDEKQK